MTGRELMFTELAVLHDILVRRDPDLVRVLAGIGTAPLDDEVRERIRRAVVDELCELPDGEDRAALQLEEILIHLADA